MPKRTKPPAEPTPLHPPEADQPPAEPTPLHPPEADQQQPEQQEVTMQVNPEIVMKRIAMLLLAMSSFHPMELELTAQFMRQNETRAKLDPNVPAAVVRTIGYNARVVTAVAGFQKHLGELERDALAAAGDDRVMRGPIVMPDGRPS